MSTGDLDEDASPVPSALLADDGRQGAHGAGKLMALSSLDVGLGSWVFLRSFRCCLGLE
jgi:hypothetical protein